MNFLQNHNILVLILYKKVSFTNRPEIITSIKMDNLGRGTYRVFKDNHET